jgi:hypothetical protein
MPPASAVSRSWLSERQHRHRQANVERTDCVDFDFDFDQESIGTDLEEEETCLRSRLWIHRRTCLKLARPKECHRRAIPTKVVTRLTTRPFVLLRPKNHSLQLFAELCHATHLASEQCKYSDLPGNVRIHACVSHFFPNLLSCLQN